MGEEKLDLAGNVLSSKEQRETLQNLSKKLWQDIKDIEQLIEKLSSDNKVKYGQIQQAYYLKLNYIRELAKLYNLPETLIEQNRGSSVTKTGDEIQINYESFNYKKLDEAARKAAKVLEEARMA